MSLNYYDILECSPSDNIQTIRKKYLRLALKYHPDKYPDNGSKFKEISQAYQFISNNHSNDNIIQSPIDLLKEALSHYDNDLADVIYDTLTHLIPNTKDAKDLWQKIIGIPQHELINTGSNLIKQYLERKCFYNGHNTFRLNINYDDLKDENNIKCSLEFLSKYSNIDLYIDNEYITNFDLKYSNISIKFNNNIYDFNFIDDFDNSFKRINTFDLLFNINNISNTLINKIIEINHPFIKNISIHIKSSSDTYLLNNFGLWNPKLNKRGDLYIHFSFIDTNTNNEFINISETIKYNQPDKIISIYDIFNK
jgi:hypothetical protein